MIRLIRNTAIMLSILYLLQTVIYFIRLQTEFPLIRRIQSSLNERILLFGDSSVGHFDREDEDKRTLTEMLDASLPNDSVVGWDQPAFDLRVYQAMIDYIVEEEGSPSLIVIPVNLRSFSKLWYLRPEWQFSFEKDALRSNMMTPVYYALKPFISQDAITLAEYRNTELYSEGRSIGAIANYEGEGYREVNPSNIRNKLMANYMYTFTDDPYGLLQVESLCRKIRQGGLEVFFYLTPLPVEEGVRYIGPDFRRVTRDNAKAVTRLISKYDLPFADWHDLLKDGQFSKDDLYKGEHYSLEGKRILIDSLSARVRSCLDN